MKEPELKLVKEKMPLPEYYIHGDDAQVMGYILFFIFILGIAAGVGIGCLLWLN